MSSYPNETSSSQKSPMECSRTCAGQPVATGSNVSWLVVSKPCPLHSEKVVPIWSLLFHATTSYLSIQSAQKSTLSNLFPQKSGHKSLLGWWAAQHWFLSRSDGKSLWHGRESARTERLFLYAGSGPQSAVWSLLAWLTGLQLWWCLGTKDH